MSVKRKGELTIASVIFMLLVIFIHAASEGVNGYQRDSLPFVLLQSAHRLSSFVVQGFIFLSGLKLFLSSNKPFSYRKFYLSRCKRVIVPYIASFVISYIYCAATQRVVPSAGHFITELLTGGLIGHFYFVSIIVQFYLLMPLWRWLVQKNAVFSLTISLLLMIVCKTAVPEILSQFSINFTLNAHMFWSYLFYFVAGIFCGRHYPMFTAFLKENRSTIFMLTAVFGVIDCANILVIRQQLYYPSWAENFHILYCIVAICFVLCLSCHANAITEQYWMKLLDRASYNVYLIHPIFIFVIDSLMNHLGIFSLTLRTGLRMVLVYILSIGICVLWEQIKLWLTERFTKQVDGKA